MEKLCIFCKHFKWTKESMWGMGSEYTGPMMEGGWATCDMRHFGESGDLEFPEDEADYREVILRGVDCDDYDQVKIKKPA
jgi:hypothetical protein